MQSADGGLRDLSLKIHWVKQFRWHGFLAHLPMARGRPAGGDRALRLPPSSFPSRAPGRRRPLLPPLLQQPTSNRPLGATAQAPATPRLKTLGFGREGMSSPPRRAGAELCSQPKSRLLFFFFSFFRSFSLHQPPAPGFFGHAQPDGPAARVAVPRVKLGHRRPLIGSKRVHAPSPARAQPEPPIRARTDGNDPILEPGCGRGRGQMAQVGSSLVGPLLELGCCRRGSRWCCPLLCWGSGHQAKSFLGLEGSHEPFLECVTKLAGYGVHHSHREHAAELPRPHLSL